MEAQKVYRAIGMMSGTSLDGVDVALIETDGDLYVKPLGFASYPYGAKEREVLRKALGRRDRDVVVERADKIVTDMHIEAVQDFLKNHGTDEVVDLIGFHGQTIYHSPREKISIQIGDPQTFASAVRIGVVGDMRQADIEAGGEGAPLLPLYHRALSAKLPKPLAVLNIGGVSNITWIGPGGENDILAFDCGPGNALIDDFVKSRTGQPYDREGQLARTGNVDEELLKSLLAHDYFFRTPPKSLDRDAWYIGGLGGLSLEDGAANLTAFTVRGILKGMDHLPTIPECIYVAGGGRHNMFVMESLSRVLPCKVDSVDVLGWNGDAIEAQGFAYLAVRAILGMALTLPGTTGVPRPMTGGVPYRAV